SSRPGNSGLSRISRRHTAHRQAAEPGIDEALVACRGLVKLGRARALSVASSLVAVEDTVVVAINADALARSGRGACVGDLVSGEIGERSQQIVGDERRRSSICLEGSAAGIQETNLSAEELALRYEVALADIRAGF